MTKAEKQQRKNLLAELAKFNGKVYFNPESGVTVVAAQSISSDNAKFGRVTVAMCSPNDKAKRKTGELIALRHWGMGESFPVKIEHWGLGFGSWQEHVCKHFSRPNLL